jgi:methionyl-tRNA formyltransferase
MPAGLERPIRVVVFGSGPELNPDVREFLLRLEAHPEIELLGGFFQASSRSLAAVFLDLWRRRKLLAFPLFATWLARKLARLVFQPRDARRRRQAEQQIAPRLHFVERIHAPEVLERVRALQPDLGLIYGSPILKPALFTIPSLGTLGIHHGKVPEYRGNKTTFWAMYHGEPDAGVTIQKINAGLDTGSIVNEGLVPIERKSYSRVMRELEALGLDLYLESILAVRNGTAAYRPQPQGQGALYRNPKFGDFVRFWIRQAQRR